MDAFSGAKCTCHGVRLGDCSRMLSSVEGDLVEVSVVLEHNPALDRATTTKVSALKADTTRRLRAAAEESKATHFAEVRALMDRILRKAGLPVTEAMLDDMMVDYRQRWEADLARLVEWVLGTDANPSDPRSFTDDRERCYRVLGSADVGGTNVEVHCLRETGHEGACAPTRRGA